MTIFILIDVATLRKQMVILRSVLKDMLKFTGCPDAAQPMATVLLLGIFYHKMYQVKLFSCILNVKKQTQRPKNLLTTN